MTIAEQVTRLKTDFDEVKAAGVATGEQNTISKIDSLYQFFSNGYRMELLSPLLNSDMSSIKNAQYAFCGNTVLTEFELPDKFRPTIIHYMFQNCTNLTRVNLWGNDTGSVLTGLFDGCTALVDAGTLNFQGVRYANNTFRNCTSLAEIRINGPIEISIDIHWSPLSKGSITSIIDALSTTTSGLTVTLSKTAVENVFGNTTADEWTALIATKSNWTVSLA